MADSVIKVSMDRARAEDETQALRRMFIPRTGMRTESPASRESGIFRYYALLFAGRADRIAAGISEFDIGTKRIAHVSRHVVRV